MSRRSIAGVLTPMASMRVFSDEIKRHGVKITQAKVIQLLKELCPSAHGVDLAKHRWRGFTLTWNGDASRKRRQISAETLERLAFELLLESTQ